ncbi:biotin-dependent carboxyltransferase family protein [Maritimibacter alkaliphilus]|uniref:5-oxoprolinase subunit C family protein n=1 Tax=Maritimibacter alkaliphilus TaxID=404236 RepID=UPI001C9521B6|nr:urea amidolyase [Maritimibacter alkaliphilus]MBY6090835.1 urea amidolyase [Maritimibacter alkaliphilus]
MTATLLIRSAGPGVSVQDTGRPNMAHIGLSRGGAADPLALHEAAALLGLRAPAAAIEMAGMGGTFEVDVPMRIALTGAPMRARIDQRDIRWNASHLLEPGQRLTVGAAEVGTYGYLTPAGGIATTPLLGSRSTHLTAGLGALLKDGDRLPLGADPAPETPAMGLIPEARFTGGTVRFIEGPQTGLFAPETLARFEETTFTRSATANRQGVRLETEAPPFAAEVTSGLSSDFILEGDLQMTGDGQPYVLLAECQTIGGYPRIGTVIGPDLARVAQAPLGAQLRFQRIGIDEADRLAATHAARLKTLRRSAKPLVRDPASIPDLLAYTLISGVTAGRELEE